MDDILEGSIWYVEDTVYNKVVVRITKIKGRNVEVSRISTLKIPLERADTTQPLLCLLLLGEETPSRSKFRIDHLPNFPFQIIGSREEGGRKKVPFKRWVESSAYVFAQGYELGCKI